MSMKKSNHPKTLKETRDYMRIKGDMKKSASRTSRRLYKLELKKGEK